MHRLFFVSRKTPPGVITAASLGLLILVTGACHRTSAVAPTDDAPFTREGQRILVPATSPLRPRLLTAPVGSEPIRLTRTAPGTVEPDPQRVAHVYPPVGGKIVKLLVTLGDTVTEGQPVAILTSPDFTSAQGDYLKAISADRSASRQLAREKELLAHKIAAERDVEDAQASADAAQAALQAARERLKLFGVDPDTITYGQALPLLAPLSGRVVELGKARGELTADSTVSIMSVADLSQVWLTVNVPEKDLRYPKPGQSLQAEFSAYPGEVFPGVIHSIGDILDPDTRTARLHVVLANPDGRLKPGLFATVRLLDQLATRLTVPTTALVHLGDRDYVYEQTAPGVLEPRAVETGATTDGRTIILSGLHSSSTVLARDGVLFQ